MRAGKHGFTLIELLVVLAIISLLLTLSLPRYFHSIDHAKEVALAENLRVTRDALDKFYSDLGKYPDGLQQLVEKRYLRALPVDPVTGSTSTWIIVSPDDASKGGVANLHSGAPGSSSDGKPFFEF